MATREELDELYFKALALDDAGDVEGALALYFQGAALGDDGAQNMIGIAYDRGRGVEKDKVKAIAWFKKAWRTGGNQWCNNIALTYAELGNARQAKHWWQKAVAQEDGDAALALAKFLLKSQSKPSVRVLDLVKMAANCEEYMAITPAGKEEAQELVEQLTATHPKQS